MSTKKNYNKISSKAESVDEAKVETVEEVVNDKPKTGVVVNCEKLNVRIKPSVGSEVVTTIKKGTKVTVDENESTSEFYKVTVGSKNQKTTGYCMRKYITIK